MTSKETHAALEAIGRQWTGRGAAVECGCWLGASSVALLRGLIEAGYDRPFYGFDKWTANSSQVAKAAAQGVTLELGQDLRPHWEANVSTVYIDLWATRCALGRMTWRGDPVEILVVDAAKREPSFSHMMHEFILSLVPGAWLVLLDYAFWKRFRGADSEDLRCQERWIAKHPAFRLEGTVGECGAVFRYGEGGL